jgi:hypothetical protein
MHHVIQSGGDAKRCTWICKSSVGQIQREGVDEVFARVKDTAKGAGLMAGVEPKVTVQSG